jgi:hypothetical protein
MTHTFTTVILRPSLMLIAFASVALMFVAAPLRAATDPPADIRLTGETGGNEDLFGWSVAPAGDVNGDSFPDLIVGAPSCDEVAGFSGRAYLFYGPFSDDLDADQADAIITSQMFGDNLGISVASAGDTNDDGRDDILIGARSNDAGGIQAGQAYLFRGPVNGLLNATQATAVITGLEFEELGIFVASGNVNNDAFDDILIGAHQFGGSSRGRVYVFFGPVSGNLPSAAANAIVTGQFSNDFLGSAIAAGDINDDGFDDLILGAPHGPIDFLDPGRTHVFLGPVAGEMNAAAADFIFHGEANNDLFGTSVATGDVNGDGLADVIVGANQLFNDGTGKAYVFLAPFEETNIFAVNANGKMIGETAGDNFGDGVGAAGDVNGDGLDDVLVGAWDNASTFARGGRAYLFLGPVAGERPALTADLIVSPEESGDRLGKDVSAAGDLDGNGRGDFIIGAPEFPVGDAGKAFVYLDHVVTTAVSDAGVPGPQHDGLGQNVPNPFNPSTIIPYRLSVDGRTAIRIYDVRGALIKSLVDGPRAAGDHRVSWDGRDSFGRAVPSGVYFYRLETPSGVESKPMMLAR